MNKLKIAFDKYLWREVGANIFLALLFLLFALSNLNSYLSHPRLSPLFAVALETVTALLFLFRSRPKQVSFSAYSWVITLAGTFGSLLLRPSSAAQDLLVGQILQVLGFTLATIAIISLWRSFGMLPADRGIRRAGAYRLVRHPLYAAYLVHHAGYLINNFDLYNVMVVVIATSFQVLRVFDEEKFLSNLPEYREYKSVVRWRFIPFIF